MGNWNTIKHHEREKYSKNDLHATGLLFKSNNDINTVIVP